MVEIDNILNEEDDNINDYKEVVETKAEVVNNKKIEKTKKPRTPAQIEAWDRALAKRRENIAKKKNGGLDPIKEEPVKEPVKKEPKKTQSNNFVTKHTNIQPDLSKINKAGLKPQEKKEIDDYNSSYNVAPQYEEDEELNAWLNGEDTETEEEEEEYEEEEIIVKKSKPKKVQQKPVPKKSKPKKIKYVYEEDSEEEYEEPIYQPKPSTNSYEGLDMRSRLRLGGF